MTGFSLANGGSHLRLLVALLALVIAIAGNGALAQDATPGATDEAASSELTSELPHPTSHLPINRVINFRSNRTRKSISMRCHAKLRFTS